MLNALGERDETAEICRDKHGNPEPDPELRDTESVPLKESIKDRCPGGCAMMLDGNIKSLVSLAY